MSWLRLYQEKDNNFVDYTVEVAGQTVNLLLNGSGGSTPSSTTMIPEEDWKKIEWDKATCDDCEQNECFGQAPNPLLPQTTKCVCGADESEHMRGGRKPCFKTGCAEFMRDE
jgi:hypothetical protein